MALEATFVDLYNQFKRLQDNLLALRLTVAEDKPLKGEVMLVDRLEDSITDTMGSLNHCLNASLLAKKAVAMPDLDRARRALNKCQEQFHSAERRFGDELVSYERLRDLATLGDKRGKEWASWAGSVKHGLEQCRDPLEGASKALAACWQELAEHCRNTSIVIHSRNLGRRSFSKIRKPRRSSVNRKREWQYGRDFRECIRRTLWLNPPKRQLALPTKTLKSRPAAQLQALMPILYLLRHVHRHNALSERCKANLSGK